MAVQEIKKNLRIGVFRGKQKLCERVVTKRSTVTVGCECKESEETQFMMLSSVMPKQWELFIYYPEKDAYALHVTKKMRGRIIVKDGVSLEISPDLKPGNGIRIKGDDIYIALTRASRGRIIIGGKILFLFQFASIRDEGAVARMLNQKAAYRRGIGSFLKSALGVALILSFLAHLIPLLYIGLQDWPRNDEVVLMPSWAKPVTLEEMKVEIENEEPQDEEPTIVEQGDDVLPSVDEGPSNIPDPNSSLSRGELMDQITDKHREQGAMITAQILGVEGGIEGFYGDMLGANTHIADMSDISAGDIGLGASGNLLNQLAAAEGGGSGGGLMGIESGTGNSGPKVVVDGASKKQTTAHAKVEFKMTDKSDFVGAAPAGSKDAIEAMFRKKQGDIKTCYQRVMNAQGKASGRFVLAITVAKDGSVLKVDKIEDQIGGEMYTCVRQRIMNWKFGALKAPIAFKKTWVFS